jgi:H/ACA ribonucleoprotein complex non-core subunit NAF1
MVLISGELASCDLPPIEDLQITVPEAECFQVGTVSSCVDDLVVIRSLPGMPVLDLVNFD